MIYLDAAAGAPLDPDYVRSLSESLLTEASVPGALFGHASSRHAGGRATRAHLADAEAALLATFGLSPTARGGVAYRVQFTHSGAEALELGVRIALLALEGERRAIGIGALTGPRPIRWLHGAGEHSAIRKFRARTSVFGIAVDHADLRFEKPPIGAAPKGESDATPTLTTLIHGQNETGLGSHIQNQRISNNPNTSSYQLIDTIASWGKAELPPRDSSARTLYAVQAGKIGALPSAAALLYPAAASPKDSANILSGARGSHLPTAHAFTYFSRGLPAIRSRYETEVASLRDYLETRLRSEPRTGSRIVFTHDAYPEEARLPHVSHFRVRAERPLDLVAKLDLRGFAISSGSACKSQSPEPSDTLLELGWSKLDALNAVRVSLSPRNSRPEIDLFVETLAEILDSIG